MENTAASAIVDTQMLTMSFSGHIALNALDASIGAGVTGLVGANGAGKTTLFNLILGLIKPSEGHLTVHGLDPTSDGPAVRSTIGFSPEHHILPDEMPADEFVRHMAQVRGLPRSEARGRASDALWLVGLGEERFRPLGTMSTGQRQRVKLAQALASDPSLILLDEPTDGLDPFQRDEMLELIASIRATVGIDVVVSSHLLEEVERICDHVVILDAGRLIAAGPIDEVVGTASPEVFAELAEGDRASLDAQVIASIVEHLSAFDLDVTVEGLTLRMAGDERLALDEFTAAAASSGARVQRLGRRRRRLEDVFVDQGVSS